MLWLPFALFVGFTLADAPSAAPADQVPAATWQADVREEVAARDLERALRITDARLSEFPDDEDARFWRARLLSWLGRWADAEQQYRHLLAVSPDNSDYLIGLANVRLGQQQPADSLQWLNQALMRDSHRPDLFVARGRALRTLGRIGEAQEAFRTALALAPGDEGALAGLASVRTEPKHRLSMTADVDYYNFTSDAHALTERLRSSWTSDWQTEFGTRVDHRSGLTVWRGIGAVSRHLPKRTTLTFGGSAGAGRDVVSNQEIFVGGGKGVRIDRGLVRGLAFEYEHRWLWFDQADVMTARPTTTLYLPHDWEAMVSVTAARSAFPGLGAEWRPAGSARLTFPVASWVSGRAFYGKGAENYALRDQIGSFSAWTAGGGARLELPGGQDLQITLARQQREQGRTQTTIGIGHGIRF